MNPHADTPLSLLLVDDDAIFRARLAASLRQRGYEVREADSAERAIELARLDSPERAVVDLRMAGASGLEVVTALKELDPSTEIIVLTGYGSIATALEAVKRGARDYLTKPLDVDAVVAALERPSDQSKSLEPVTQTPSLARVEWEHIQRVMTDCDGNVSEAARRLGLHRRSLQRKLSKFPALR